jgi:hypothetical protein
MTVETAEGGVMGKSGSHRTLRWRETDSNPRSPVRGTTFFETARFDHSGNSTPAAETGSFATRINAPQGIAGRAPGVGVDAYIVDQRTAQVAVN